MTDCPECGTIMQLDGCSGEEVSYLCPGCEEVKYVDPLEGIEMESYFLRCPECGQRYIEGDTVDAFYHVTKPDREYIDLPPEQHPKASKVAECPECQKKLVVEVM